MGALEAQESLLSGCWVIIEFVRFRFLWLDTVRIRAHHECPTMTLTHRKSACALEPTRSPPDYVKPMIRMLHKWSHLRRALRRVCIPLPRPPNAGLTHQPLHLAVMAAYLRALHRLFRPETITKCQREEQTHSSCKNHEALNPNPKP